MKRRGKEQNKNVIIDAHTHTHIHTYMHICICVNRRRLVRATKMSDTSGKCLSPNI